MAEIETGDYFVVRRGYPMGQLPPLLSFFGPPSTGYDGWLTPSKPDEPTGPKYDRSWEGMLFEALECCPPMIAGRAVWTTGYKEDRVGQVVSFNMDEVELWPVTRKYAVACGVTVVDV